MLYYAELRGKKVFTQEGQYVGRLSDLVFLAAGQPIVTKLVVRSRNRPHLIPTKYLTGINARIRIATTFDLTSLSPNELFISKNLMDQQIIDIKGNKIVRVNDVAIQDKPYPPVIAGVDIGLLGLLRWLRVEQVINRVAGLFNRSIQSTFLPYANIQPLELSRGKVKLRMEHDKLENIAPEDLADHLEKMNLRNITKVLDLLDEEYEAEVIESLNTSFQQSLFEHFSPKRAAAVIERIDPDEAVDILLTLPEHRRTEILTAVSPEKSTQITSLLGLSKTAIGGLINPEFLTVTPEQTVKSVRAQIKSKTGDFSSMSYVYVVNKKDELVGIFDLHELALAEADTPVYKFMNQNVVAIHLTTPEEIAIKKILKYRIRALPVIDADRKILGIVTFDDLAGSTLTVFNEYYHA